MKTFKIGVVGLGQRIAHVLGAMAEVGWSFEVAGYVDPAPIGASIAEGFHIDTGAPAPTLKALVERGPLDLIMIGAPNHLHYDYLRAALELATPIFVEKPIVRTQEETMALAAALARANTPAVYVGLVMRSMPIVRETLRRVASGALGEIVSIDATEHLHPEHGAYLARNWRRKQEFGGSYFLDKVCHDFDIFNAIADARPARVASFGGRTIFHPGRADAPRVYSDGSPAFTERDAGWSASNDPFQSDMDVADHQVAIVEYGNGVRLSFHANTCVGLQERRWYVAGTEGTLIADLVRNKLLVRRALDRGRPERIDFATRTADNHNGADQAMALDLKRALEGAAPFPATPFAAMEAGLTIMALDQSAAEGSVLECGPLWSRFDAARGLAPPAET